MFACACVLAGCAGGDQAPLDGDDAAIDAADVPLDAAADASSSMRKWSPGHYYALSGDTFNDQIWAGVLADLAETPRLRGVLVRYAWTDLEGAEGVYDFSHIQSRLTSLGGRKLMLFIQLKTFDAGARAVPPYLRTAAYDGGDFAWVNGAGVVGGYAPRLMNPMVRQRVMALMSALAAAFDDDPRVEAVIFPETALTEYPSWSGTNEADFWAGLRAVDAHRAAVFQKTISCQWVNYPRDRLATFVPDIRDNLGLALGGPDIVPQEPGLLQPTPPNIGAYVHIERSVGIVPIIYNASGESYTNQRIDDTGDPQSIDQIYTFARDTLHVTHLTWTRVPAYRPQVLDYLQTHDAPLPDARPVQWP